MKLYKYLNEDRISILEDGLVRFTQPQAFNDPFELKPQLSSLASDSMIAEELNEQFEDIIKNEYLKLPSEIKQNISYSKFLEYSYTKKDEVLNNIIAMSKKIMPMLNNEMHKTLENHIGIFSLTECDHNLLMWAHYANSHKGYVIEFDSEHDFFNQKKSDNDVIRSLEKVSYSNYRPKLEMVSIENIDPFIVKSKEWKYEKEWRMLHSLKDSDVKITEKPYDIHLFKVPFEAINSISIGARATDEIISLIKNKLFSNNSLKHVQLSRFQIHDSEFKLVKFDV